MEQISFSIVILFLTLDEDIKLNSQVFHWPEQLQTIFDASSAKLQTGREKSEDELKAKVKGFEDKLAGYEKEVDSFRKKEVSAVAYIYLVIILYLVKTITSSKFLLNLLQHIV